MKRPRIGGAALSLLLLLLAGGRLSAQSHRNFLDEWNSIREGARLRLGPFRIDPALRIFDAGYDSNVTFRPDGEAAVPDYTAMLSPEIKGYWLIGNSLILSVTENPEYHFFLKERNLRAFTNSFASGLRFLALRRFSLSAEYHVRQHVRRSTSELDRRIEDTVKGWEGSLFFETARGTSFGVSGLLDEYRYRDVASEFVGDLYARALDRRESAAAFEFYYRVFSQSYFFATAGVARDEFRFPESAWRNANSFRVMSGIRFPLLGRARGQIALGWKTFTPGSPDRKAFSGFVSASDISVRAWRFGFDLGYTRDNYYSYLETAYYYVEDLFRSGVSFYLTPSLRLDAGLRHGALDYPEPQIVWHQGQPVLVANRRDIHRTCSVGLAVRMAGSVGLGLSYNFYRRTSNAPGFDVGRNFLGASVTYDF